MAIPKPLIEAIARGNAVLFCGAGLSRGAGLPSWSELLEPLAEEIDLPQGRRSDLLQVAQDYENTRGRQPLIEHIRERTDTTGVSLTENHRRLPRLGIDTWVTTNYDDLLEKTLDEAGRRKNVVVRDQNLPYTTANRVTLIKLHGDGQDPDTIVITKNDYSSFFFDYPRIKTKLDALLTEKTFLFLGYSVSDPDFDQLLAGIRHDIKEHQRPAYAVMFDADQWDIADLKARNIHALDDEMRGKANYGERLGELLDELTVAVDALRPPGERSGPALRTAARHPAPFYTPPLPDHFVQRPHEFQQVLAHLQDELAADKPIALTTALQGGGGFGKTTLAIALCDHLRQENRFPGGILWVELGQTPDRVGLLNDQITLLSGERAAFTDVHAASAELRARLAGRKTLLVLDDVWDEVHARPFLPSGEGRWTTLITTRRQDLVVRIGARPIDVSEMSTDQAAELLVRWMPEPPVDTQPLRDLAQALGEWPLLLELAAAYLRQCVAVEHSPLPKAVTELRSRLRRKGLTYLDRTSEGQRNQAISISLDVSLTHLGPRRERYLELAVFPEEADIPLSALARLWRETGRLDEIDAEDAMLAMQRLSLFTRYDPLLKTVRLHDVIRQYLIEQRGDRLPALHARLLKAHRPGKRTTSPSSPPSAPQNQCTAPDDEPSWHKLPPDEPYMWRHLAHHLYQAGHVGELRTLLLDYNWLQAKLEAIDINALLADFDLSLNPASVTRSAGDSPKQELKSLSTLKSALRRSAHVLTRDQTQLAGHLRGRLFFSPLAELQALIAQARAWRGAPWLCPLTPSLMPPVGPLRRTLEGHRSAVRGVVVTANGTRAVSASDDHTLKVWDLTGEVELRTLEGHRNGVTAIAIIPGDARAISASYDRTLKVWDLEQGHELHTLEGHTSCVRAVAVTPDGARAVSASDDDTLKVWNLDDGQELHVLKGHSKPVSAVAVTPDSKYAISSSHDHTLKIWDLEQGCELHTLEGHQDHVLAVRVTPDGTRAISTSHDHTLKVWDLKTAQELCTLTGHRMGVTAVAVTRDSTRAVSASYDRMLKVWDLKEGRALHNLEGHTSPVRAVAVTPDGTQAVSASTKGRIIIWDCKPGPKYAR